MNNLTLREGFSWVESDNPETIEFKHDETGKHGAISACVKAVDFSVSGLQREVDYLCCRILIEAGMDRLWAECGRDAKVFAKRRAEVTA